MGDASDLIQKELSKYPVSLGIFQQLPRSHQNEYIKWISEAKKVETRIKRIHKMTEMLLDRRKI